MLKESKNKILKITSEKSATSAVLLNDQVASCKIILLPQDSKTLQPFFSACYA